jgi:predicted nucleic acid-binding Zn ribbon protein
MERAAAGLIKMLADILRRVPAGEAPLMVWPMICGQAVAQRTKAVSFSDGVLRIEVPDTAWRAQLSELSGKYLAGINAVVPEPVRRIVFDIAETTGNRR